MRKKFKLNDELPNLIRKYKTFSPTELKKLILQDFNKDLTDKSIIMTMSAKRDKKGIYKALREELSQNAQSEIEVSTDLFKNGNFEASPVIKKWNIEKATLVSPSYQEGNVQAIKRVCQGVFYLKDHVTKKLTEVRIDGWTPKSPERLTLEQFQEFIANVHKAGTGTKTYRIAFRDFWLSREGKTLKPTEVSGDMPKIGKWKHAFVPKDVINKILEYVKSKNYVAYVCDLAMYKTGTRSTATLECFLKSNLHKAGNSWIVTILDKGFHRKGRKEWDKIITEDLLAHLNKLWENNNNAFTGLDEQVLRDLNKEAYRLYLDPNTAEYDLAMSEPNHFWRHAFGAHMLRIKDKNGVETWNYDAVAFLGGWDSTDMLKKVYGAPPEAMLRAMGMEFIPQL